MVNLASLRKLAGPLSGKRVMTAFDPLLPFTERLPNGVT
jgi:hypothetical protein